MNQRFLTLFGMTHCLKLQDMVRGDEVASDHIYTLYNGSSFRTKRSGVRNPISKHFIIILFLCLIVPANLFSQGRNPFSGDYENFKPELTAFMGQNLRGEQLETFNAFINRWDSPLYNLETRAMIVSAASLMASRAMRPVPHFTDFFNTINAFASYSGDENIFSGWIRGLYEALRLEKYSNDLLLSYIRNFERIINKNTLFESASVRWKVSQGSIRFVRDTLYSVAVTNATLTCISQRDSTMLHNVVGQYSPVTQTFTGTQGVVLWEKAGFTPEEVSAELTNFSINMTRNSYTVDSARLKHKTYFTEPVYGTFSDRTTNFSSPERANFPQFLMYKKDFKINNLYEGINYEGGLLFEGANVKGMGENLLPAKITLYRNDTLYLKITAKELLFSKTGINSQEVAMTLFLDTDSIYHTNLGFSYLAGNRQVNLFRTNNPVSRSPYFNSFHNMDMYFEYLTWNMNESKVSLSRARGTSTGEAIFQSASYFKGDDFYRMMGFDDYHPLNRITKFAEYYYSETFPVSEFAKWLGRPDEAAIAMCVDLANRGFIFYDRLANRVTIKQKTKDYLNAFAEKQDYDEIRIVSSTSNNAILDLTNYDLIVEGVRGVLLSDTQKVALFPYDGKLIIEKNRTISFDGIVEAGLFTIYGKQFSFTYDSFKLQLQKMDSLKIAVLTDQRDRNGNPVTRTINSMIELGTAEILIDDPTNKSGLKDYEQYPVFNSTAHSYIFYDKIPNLEGIYPREDFHFKIDPFTFENINYFSSEDFSLAGEFIGGKILSPTRHKLTTQDDNSLGFDIVIPDEGINIYESKAVLFNQIQMSNKGLTGAGTIKRLTSTTVADEFFFYPDSMITEAKTFIIERDPNGLFPALQSSDISVKWLTQTDEWIAESLLGKKFEIFNEATLDGTINLTPTKLMASGEIDMPDSKITSNLFSFRANAIRADTADYNFKSRTTNDYSFSAENVNADINFDSQLANFRLNAGLSMVKFPEIQYISTMSDFSYDMQKRILYMEQTGRSNTPLMTAEMLVKQSFASLDKPTFFSTGNPTDTIAFSSWRGLYDLDNEIIKAENINYIHIADALIQPSEGVITLSRKAVIEPLHNAVIAVNNKHILQSASINIETSEKYGGSAVYNYHDEDNNVQQIQFSEISVDALTTTARGVIPQNQNFMLSQAFTFTGDVLLSAHDEFLTFSGAAGITQNCNGLLPSNIIFKSIIDPERVLIPVAENARDINNELVVSGSVVNIDDYAHIYPAFLSVKKSRNDNPLVDANGYLYFEKEKGRYLIGSLNKLTDLTQNGNMVIFDKIFCVMSGEGILDFGANYDLFKLSSAGSYIHNLDSNIVKIEALLAADFHFSADALKIMADELRLMPTLSPVNLNSNNYTKAMRDLLGVSAANQLQQEIGLFGSARSLPREFTYKLVLNDVKLYWNASTASFRSEGKIGIGFIGEQPLNVYVDGYVEIQRRRSGDMLDIYLKANDNTWYYFSYLRGTLMTQSSNTSYNNLITNAKTNSRRHPNASARVPYTYMIAPQGRLTSFLRRMASDNAD